MSQENRAVIDRLDEEAFRQGNTEAIDELLTQDFVDHNPLPGIAGDREGYKEFVQYRHQAFADQLYTVHDQIAVDDRVVERWSMAMTHAGDFLGIQPTGKRVTLTGIAIARLEGGRIAEIWEECDAVGLFEQLGSFPAQETVA
jgi:predicted ester cyclase